MSHVTKAPWLNPSLISEGINKRLPVRLAIFYDPLSDAVSVVLDYRRATTIR